MAKQAQKTVRLPSQAEPLPHSRENLVLLLHEVGRVIRLQERDLGRLESIEKRNKELIDRGLVSRRLASATKKAADASDKAWAQAGSTLALVQKYIEPRKLKAIIDLQKAFQQQFCNSPANKMATKSDRLAAAGVLRFHLECQELRLGLFLDLRGRLMSKLELLGSEDKKDTDKDTNLKTKRAMPADEKVLELARIIGQRRFGR